VEVTPLAEGDRLCLFSDGVTEARGTDGELFGEERLEECLSRNQGNNLLKEIKTAVDEFCSGRSQSDDVTMVEIICDSAAACPVDVATPRVSKPKALDWGMVIELAPNKIRDMDPLPMIMYVLMQDKALYQHKENIFLIVSEFFTNALDHGLLGMDGTLKQTMEGMIQYFSEREKALAALEDGTIRIEIKNTIHQGDRVLIVVVEDSGPGFDCAIESASLRETCSMGGRGIQLARSLCKEVVFHGCGNKVEATYVIG